MSLGFLFWLIVVIGIILWGWLFAQPSVPYAPYHPAIWWVLIIILGIGVFGWPIHA